MFALGALGLTFKAITTNSKNHILFFFKKQENVLISDEKDCLLYPCV